MSLSDRFDHTQVVSAVMSGLSSPDETRARARRFVAVSALDFEDRCLLLDALGLGPTADEVAAFKRSATDDTVIQAEEATER